uniref:ARAD1B11616p n=1 Tax=Blastobotrys adeninivorans TaxID=409370 RepID=A0A060T6F2_BLAAD
MSLLDWARSNGASIAEGVVIKDTPHGRGLVATKPVSGEVVSIPESLLVTADFVQKYSNSVTDPLGTWLKQLANDDNTPPRRSLCGFLFYQKHLINTGKPDPKWSEWVKSLPTHEDMNLPFTWEDGELKQIEHTSIFQATLAKKRFVSAFYETRLEPLIHSKAAFHDWVLCEEWVASRALSLKDGRIAMVPVVDMCNHDSFPNSMYTQEGIEGCNLVTHGNVNEDTELTITYGHSGAGEFLFNYGFIPHAKDAGELSLLFDPMEDDIVQHFVPESDSIGLGHIYQTCTISGFVDVPSRLILSSGDKVWDNDFILLFTVFPHLEYASRGEDDEEGFLTLKDKVIDLQDLDQSVKAADEKIYAASRRVGDYFVSKLISDHIVKPANDSHPLVALENALYQRVTASLTSWANATAEEAYSSNLTKSN